MKWGFISLLVFIFCVSVLIFGKNGYLDYYRLQRTYHHILSQNEDLLRQNQQLQSRINRFQHDPTFRKLVIKHQLSVVEKGEIVLVPAH